MLPPFGFSVGDFVSGINLIRELTKALEDSAGSAAEYRELIKELYSLERALLEVKALDLDESQHAQQVALRQAATQCQQTIDGFLQKIRKFQPALCTGGSKSSWRDGLRKVEWALYKKEDVEKFRAQINGHTASINILLMTVQLQASTIQAPRFDQQQDTGKTQSEELVVVSQGIKSNHQILGTNTDLLLALTRVVHNAATQEHTQDLKDLMVEVLRTNLQLYDMVLSLQANLPQQIERQRPVLFLDACGYLSPVHLEFITSAEAFLAVLKVRFKDAGLQKIERGQFALENAQTKRAVDLKRPWHLCMLPGQRIDMSMIFSESDVLGSTCPGCQRENTNAATEDVECTKCGLLYRRITELTGGDGLPDFSRKTSNVPEPSASEQRSDKRKLPDSFYESQPGIRAHEELDSDSEDSIHHFRRVHIKPRPNVFWSATNKHPYLIRQGNDLDLRTDYTMTWPSQQRAVAAHANKPFDRNFTYFEVTVLSSWGEAGESDGVIGVGLCNSYEVACMPGMVLNSWGFHSDDGKAFRGVASSTYRKYEYGPSWSEGDTVGCGWDPVCNQNFFTMNGNYMGPAFQDIAPQLLYPTIAISWASTHVHIRANFGKYSFKCAL